MAVTCYAYLGVLNWFMRLPPDAMTSQATALTPIIKGAFAIYLDPNKDPSHRRHFNQLSEQDKRLISMLWQAMPELLSQMQNGRSYRGRCGEEVLRPWKPVLKN